MNQTKTFQQNFDDTLSLFNLYVKKELESWQKVNVLSFEGNRTGEKSFLSILDQRIGCDLGLWDGEDLFFVANRVLSVDTSTGDRFPLSITLRDSVKGSYDQAEINKLKRLCDLNGKQLHHPMPNQMIFSRVVTDGPQPYLLDMVIIQTALLMEFLFDMRGFNLIALRERYRQQGRDHIDFCRRKPFWGGIRLNKSDGNTFVAISTSVLKEYNVPFQYKKFPSPIVVDDCWWD